MKKIFTNILLLFFIFLNCLAQDKKIEKVTVNCNKSVEIYGSDINKKVKNIIDKNANLTLKNPLINSLSIGIYINNANYIFHYGELTKDRGDKPRNETIYEIASVTKTFVGTLVSKAVLEGRINLEDDIRKYLLKAYPNLEFEGNPIRLKHLLTHTSGIPSQLFGKKTIRTDLNEIEFNKAFLKQEDNQTKQKFLKNLLQLKLKEKPGTSFEYSNAGTNLVAYILENIYKKPFQDMVINRIIKKTEMKHTHFITPKNKRKDLANGYLLEKPMPETNLAKTLWGAEGALKSTLPDMLKYMHYQFKNDAIVNESHKKIYEIDSNYWIGYFWWIIENQNYDLHYRHDGGISRAKNIFVMFPEKKIGISIFTNQSSQTIYQKLNDLTYNIYNDLKKSFD